MASIYQHVRYGLLSDRLQQAAAELRIWPRMTSTDTSLNGQPAAPALTRRLAEHRQIVLEGPPGSGKTVLGLFLATHDPNANFVYLEGQKWIPTNSRSLVDDFIIAAGCDHDRAQQALKAGKLSFILDGADEAPWRSGGAGALDFLPELSDRLAGKAGLLVTTRTSRPLPTLPAGPSPAVLGGIPEDSVADFLAHYAGTRSGVSEAAASLRASTLRPEIKYSPLLLRHFAEGLATGDLPANPVGLFERIAEFHIKRECGKPSPAARPPASAWQAAYSDPARHRCLAAALTFVSDGTGRTIPEAEFREIAQTALDHPSFGAHALVDLSTLMAQHPLVGVSHQLKDNGEETYHVRPSHDWVRTALLPWFAAEECFAAQVLAADMWHRALPHADDFVHAWSHLGARAATLLAKLVDLASSPDQAREVATWLLLQVFHPALPSDFQGTLLTTASRLAGRVLAARCDPVSDFGVEPRLMAPMVLEKCSVSFDDEGQNPNMSGVAFRDVQVHLGKSAPSHMTLRRCLLDGTEFTIEGRTVLHLDACLLQSVRVDPGASGVVELNQCLVDQPSCRLGANVEGRETSRFESVGESFRTRLALAEVLRRLIHLPDPTRLELAKKKTNVSDDTLYRHLVKKVGERAHGVVDQMVADGYLKWKPTGEVRRYDPTAKFDAVAAARFIVAPAAPAATQGVMIQELLRKL